MSFMCALRLARATALHSALRTLRSATHPRSHKPRGTERTLCAARRVRRDSSCAECKSLKRTIALAQKDPAFEGKLRFGQVDCSKHLELCTRFGVSGDDEGATGYPYVMWFRAGAEVGAYDGERSVEGLSVWTQEKEGQGLLFSYA